MGYKIAGSLLRSSLIPLLLGVPFLISCAVRRDGVGRCCAAGLLDPGKLQHANSSGLSPEVMTLTLDYAPGQSFDLTTLLREPTAAHLLWTSNGAAIGGAVLLLRSAPKENATVVYTIAVHREDGPQSDTFQLISLPSGTRRKFDNWLLQEQKDLAWLALLPPVYSSLGPNFSDPEPRTCSKSYWEGVHKLATNYHPGGAYEMRSRMVGNGSGHQAVYNAGGQLIRDGLGAGSADKGSPRFGGAGYLKHRDRDVLPFIWAAQLDGNPVNPTWWYRNLDKPLIRFGDHIRQYQSVRPALANHPSEIAAGECVVETRK